jgi:hypothetical protein
MKVILIVLSGFTFIFFACSKNDFKTKPTIEVKSASTDVVAKNNDLTLILKVKDKEGDVDDSLFVIRQRINKVGPATRVIRYKIPEYPDKSDIEMQVDLSYVNFLTLNLSPLGPLGQFQPDTLDLKFVVRDRANNTSDTVTQNVIVIR